VPRRDAQSWRNEHRYDALNASATDIGLGSLSRSPVLGAGDGLRRRLSQRSRTDSAASHLPALLGTPPPASGALFARPPWPASAAWGGAPAAGPDRGGGSHGGGGAARDAATGREVAQLRSQVESLSAKLDAVLAALGQHA
jgi:hypothetical protein